MALAKKSRITSEEITNRAVGALRQQLSPLYRALQQVFGEIDALDTEMPSASGAIEPRKAKVWESWKARFGGKTAEMIDALLTHREMTATQLRIAIQCRQQTIYDSAYKLNSAGLIDKNGGKYSLKEL